MAVSIVALAGAGGAIFYTNRQITSISEETKELKEHTSTNIRKTEELEKSIQEIAKVLRPISMNWDKLLQHTNSLQKKIDDKDDEIYELEATLDAVLESLKKAEISVTLPRKPKKKKSKKKPEKSKKKPKKKSKRVVSESESDESEEDSEDESEEDSDDDFIAKTLDKARKKRHS